MWQEGEVGSEEGIRMQNKSWVHEDKRGEAVVWELVSTRTLLMLKLKPCFRRSAHPAARTLPAVSGVAVRSSPACLLGREGKEMRLYTLTAQPSELSLAAAVQTQPTCQETQN